MKDAKMFVDTNILVYAYDLSAGNKHEKAKEIVKDLWRTGEGLISTQVAQEFFVTVTRKIAKPLGLGQAREIVKDLLQWKTVTVDGSLIVDAINIQEKYLYAFWDSLIIASAIEGGAGTIISEDLSDNQRIKNVTIQNPFAEKAVK
jgi:predicted nucleic acid-binding protein